MPPPKRSPAEFTLAWHLARAVEDLLTVAPIELALTETMGYCCADPAPRLPHPGLSPKVRPSGAIGSGLGPRAATTQGRSALDCVVQVQHAVALDHPVGIVEEDGSGVAAPALHSPALI